MIIKCRECTKDVSTEAAACPSCGCPLQPTQPVAELSTASKESKSHMFGWLALITFLMSNFIPAILAPLIVLAGFVFAVLEINKGGKIFGWIMFTLFLFQSWAIADHFGGLRGSLGITNPKQIEEATAKKYSATNLNVPSDADQTIEQKCTEDWPNDFRMRKYCQDQQREAVKVLDRGQPASISHEAFIVIRGKCTDDWPRDFKMRAYCETQQFESYRALQATAINDAKRGGCAQQWPNDYKMRQYCEQKG